MNGLRRVAVARCSLDATLVAFLLATGAACISSSSSSAAPQIVLIGPPEGPAPGAVEVRGLPPRDLTRLRRVTWSREDWERLLRVAIGRDQPSVLGAYTVTADAVRFTPRFPFDAGRRYDVTFDPSRVPGAAGEPWRARRIVAAVARPASIARPSISVAGIHPSGPVVPENQLRLYIHFSGPMGRQGGFEHVRLLDERGVAVEDPFLPLDTELWNDDRTRFTLFFDPGRVKRGILPNQRMGRPLRAGRRYTLVVSREWKDAHGLPLTADFRHAFRVGPPDARPLDPASWTIDAPTAGSRDPLRVSFPAPLDYGLLVRALGVARDGRPIAGAVAVEASETRWAFTPHEAWREGRHALVALGILEDPAGNRIGRAFEVVGAAEVPETESITIPFEIAARRPP